LNVPSGFDPLADDEINVLIERTFCALDCPHLNTNRSAK
jgi:hypothetical protein